MGRSLFDRVNCVYINEEESNMVLDYDGSQTIRHTMDMRFDA